MMAIIICPFYKEHGYDTIVCEKLHGSEEKGENHFFEDRKKQMVDHCNSLAGWKQCEYAKQLIKKYGG